MLGFVKTVEVEPVVKEMKLSTAMLKGYKMRPQIRGMLYNKYGSCALGAAWEGKTGQPAIHVSDQEIRQNFNIKWIALAIVIANDYLSIPRPVIAYALKLIGK